MNFHFFVQASVWWKLVNALQLTMKDLNYFLLLVMLTENYNCLYLKETPCDKIQLFSQTLMLMLFPYIVQNTNMS